MMRFVVIPLLVAMACAAVFMQILNGCKPEPLPNVPSVPSVIDEMAACRAGCLPFAMSKYVTDRGCVCSQDCRAIASKVGEGE